MVTRIFYDLDAALAAMVKVKFQCFIYKRKSGSFPSGLNNPNLS